RVASARQNGQGNERKEGSHRESVSKTRVARRGQGQTLGQGSNANSSSFHPLCLLGEFLPRDWSSPEASALDHGRSRAELYERMKSRCPRGRPGDRFTNGSPSRQHDGNKPIVG